MIEDVFIFDNVVHMFNASEEQVIGRNGQIGQEHWLHRGSPSHVALGIMVGNAQAAREWRAWRALHRDDTGSDHGSCSERLSESCSKLIRDWRRFERAVRQQISGFLQGIEHYKFTTMDSRFIRVASTASPCPSRAEICAA